MSSRAIIAIPAEALATPDRLDRLMAAIEHERPEVLAVVAVDAHRAEPFTAAAVLAARRPAQRLGVVIDPESEHPYSLARRAASLHVLSRGSAGVLFLRPDADGDTGLARESAATIEALWRTWPLASITEDRVAGRFADASLLSTADGEGRYRTRGPLTVPLDTRSLPSVEVWGAAAVPVLDLTGLDPDAVIKALRTLTTRYSQ